jgi:hypothetical protein
MFRAVLFSTLIATALLFPPATAAAGDPPSPSGVVWENGLLTVAVSAVDLRALLSDISAKSGIPIVLDQAIGSAAVTWRGEALPIEKALDGILAAAGERGYLMARGRDNGILLVSRGKGKGLSPQALEVLETAILKNGAAASFFPRELVVIVHLPSDQEPSLERIIPLLEQRYALAFMGRTEIQDRFALRFRILGGAPVIDRVREICAAAEKGSTEAGLPGEALEIAVPNGLGVGPTESRAELPAGDLYVRSPMSPEEERSFLRRVREDGLLQAQVEKWPFMRLGKVGCDGISNKMYFYYQGSFQLMVDSRDRDKWSLENLLVLFAGEGGFIYGVERYVDSTAFIVYFPDLTSDETHCARFKAIEEKIRQAKVFPGTTLFPLGWSSYKQPQVYGNRP